MNVKYINPEGMAKPRGYSHAVSVSGNHKTVYIGGQNAVDERGFVVGKNNLREQTNQVLGNIEKILKNSGGKLENIVKFNIYLLQGQNPADGFQSFQEKWKDSQNFPAITVVFVSGLGNPDWLVEIDAIAVIEE